MKDKYESSKYVRAVSSWEIVLIKIAIREYLENHQEEDNLFKKSLVNKDMEQIYKCW